MVNGLLFILLGDPAAWNRRGEIDGVRSGRRKRKMLRKRKMEKKRKRKNRPHTNTANK